MRKAIVSATVLCFVVVVAAKTANADIANGSFEAPAKTGSWTYITADSWNLMIPEGSQQVLPCLAHNVTAYGGIPDGSQFQQLAAYADGAIGAGAHFWQNTGWEVEEGKTYDLSGYATGTGVNDPTKSTWISLTLASDSLSDGVGSPVATASNHNYRSFAAVSTSYTGTAEDAGKYLVVSLGSDLLAFNTGAGNWDAITITPEPSTLVSVIAGLISLLAYAWRRRR